MKKLSKKQLVNIIDFLIEKLSNIYKNNSICIISFHEDFPFHDRDIFKEKLFKRANKLEMGRYMLNEELLMTYFKNDRSDNGYLFKPKDYKARIKFLEEWKKELKDGI